MPHIPAHVEGAGAGPVGLAEGRTARTESNSRLTAIAGVALFVLLAGEGVTILRIHELVAAHVAIGMVLLGPLVVKLGSTGWRFLRYYSGDADYGRAGPPRLLLRVLAPIVVLSTVAVFATGIALLTVRPGHGSILVLVHKATFVGWFGVMTIHVLAYIGGAVKWVVADVAGHGPPKVLACRRTRYFLMLASLMVGLALGAAGLGWAQPWVRWFSAARGGET